jgi:enoyl-CoA hydratase/carnithine racemase
MNTGTNQLLCDVEDGVAIITMNRPEKRNALSSELTPAFCEALLSLDHDPAVRCVIVTGAGTAFCSGGDVSGMGGGGPAPTVESAIRQLQQGQEALTLRLFELSKPTIAVLPGPAAGAGFSIALACDLRIAAESAFVATAFGNIGASGDYGGSWLLTRLVGTSRARELYFTGRRVSAKEGRALGIFNEVVPDATIQEHARTLAGQIAAGPPIATRYMKENLNRAMDLDLRACLAMEADRMVRSMRTDDHREAVAAFMEKRKPVFHGK